MNIGLFTSVFFNNIGNGFIDLGAEETIKAVMPENSQITSPSLLVTVKFNSPKKLPVITVTSPFSSTDLNLIIIFLLS